jgi:hypothetical protein
MMHYNCSTMSMLHTFYSCVMLWNEHFQTTTIECISKVIDWCHPIFITFSLIGCLKLKVPMFPMCKTSFLSPQCAIHV